MLEECWMKVYIVCTCHPIYFIQHASLFILSFNVKSKMATDMLLPELVNSDYEKPRRGKSRNRISFLNLSFFSVYSVYFLWSTCFFFFHYLQFLLLHVRVLLHFVLVIQIDGQNLLCCCSSSLRFGVYVFFYCYYLAERFSFVESFEIRSSNIPNDV